MSPRFSARTAAADQEAWIEADKRAWTSYLRAQPGFVSKQVWIDRQHLDQVHAVIVWFDEALWKAIPEEELIATDEKMGEWRRSPAERVYDVACSR